MAIIIIFHHNSKQVLCYPQWNGGDYTTNGICLWQLTSKKNSIGTKITVFRGLFH